MKLFSDHVLPPIFVESWKPEFNMFEAAADLRGLKWNCGWLLKHRQKFFFNFEFLKKWPIKSIFLGNFRCCRFYAPLLTKCELKLIKTFKKLVAWFCLYPITFLEPKFWELSHFILWITCVNLRPIGEGQVNNFKISYRIAHFLRWIFFRKFFSRTLMTRKTPALLKKLIAFDHDGTSDFRP